VEKFSARSFSLASISTRAASKCSGSAASNSLPRPQRRCCRRARLSEVREGGPPPR
jgi:hypothetical protein